MQSYKFRLCRFVRSRELFNFAPRAKPIKARYHGRAVYTLPEC